MEDVDENVSSTGFEPLFIKEEEREEKRECNMAQSGFTFTGNQMNPSALMKPYLHEMDELLNSCEELTGIPFGTRFSESYTETSMNESIHVSSKEEVTMESSRETNVSPPQYLSTNYIDTHMDGAGTDDQLAADRCEVTTEVSQQTEMPITSAGNKLSETMVEYEGQLLGMLAMLESCMEEAGMDFEPQDWATDESHEYVHISKKPHLYRGTTLVPIEQERLVKLESQPMQFESWAGKYTEGDKVSSDVRLASSTNRSQWSPLLGCDSMGGTSAERLERSEKINEGAHDLQFKLSGSPELSDGQGNDPVYCAGTKRRYMFDEGTETKEDTTDDTEMAAEERSEVEMDTTELRPVVNELGELGSQMEQCIEEVQQLEKRRKELLAEVLQLRGNKAREEAEGNDEEEEVSQEQIDSKVSELLKVLKSEEEGRREERKREVQNLREERAEEERRMWKVNLERQGLLEELRNLRRRLFIMARDCTHSQASLNNKRHEIELLKREEEKLQSIVHQLTEESCQLRSAHQQLLLQLRAAIHAQTLSQTSNTQEELTEYRRHSCGDIEQYVQGGLRALENRYEPILLALLKRREAAAGALVKAKEQAQELRGQLRPLREEIEKLKLQRACLEEKLKLIHIQRREDVGQYKERVYILEERSRELKTELKIQKKKYKEIEELRDSLNKQLLLYRTAIEDHCKCDVEEQT